MISLRGLAVACPFAVIAFLVGCSHDGKPGPLAPQFATVSRTQKEMAADPLSGADQPGALYRNSQVDQPGAPESDDQSVRGLSKTVQENVTAPGARPDDALAHATTKLSTTKPATTQLATSNPSTTAPSTQSASAALGQYLTIGGVVAEVNGSPIYANKVIQLVEPVLAAQAKDLDPGKFRLVARKEITKQMLEMRNALLEYAAAERNLDQKDKDLAEILTMDWRRRQETAAGSAERAKSRARERGQDYEEMLQERYRLIMSQIYYEKKVIPRIQINATDMREYYDHNRDREFTDHGVAQFKLIKLDVRKRGGHDEALKFAEELRNRITKAGERFDAIARSVNDDPRLLRSGGEVGKIDQGAFVVEPVDKAVWETPGGQVTPIIDTGDALYLALVEEKKPGKVLPFEDEAVQQKIIETLKAKQFREARQTVQERLVKDAVIRSSDEMMNIAVEMAMQNYPRWHVGG